MVRLGIVACQIFEDELATILNAHPGIGGIVMRRTKENRRVARHLSRLPTYCNDYDLLPSRCTGMEILVEVLPAALHTSPEGLADACNEAIDAMKLTTRTVLLLYGLCGNALSGVFSRSDVHLVILEDGGIADDCFAGLLGKESYLRELARQGSFFLTKGWVTHWDAIAPRIAGTGGMGTMLAQERYERTLYIAQDGVDDEESLFRAECLSSDLALPQERAEGCLHLLESALERGMHAARTAPRIPPRIRRHQ